MLNGNRRDDLGVDLKLPRQLERLPDRLMINNNSVVQHYDAVPHHRLIIGKPVGNQPAMPKDDIARSRNLTHQAGDRVIRSMHYIMVAITKNQPTRIPATLLGMPYQSLYISQVGPANPIQPQIFRTLVITPQQKTNQHPLSRTTKLYISIKTSRFN